VRAGLVKLDSRASAGALAASRRRAGVRGADKVPEGAAGVVADVGGLLAAHAAQMAAVRAKEARPLSGAKAGRGVQQDAVVERLSAGRRAGAAEGVVRTGAGVAEEEGAVLGNEELVSILFADVPRTVPEAALQAQSESVALAQAWGGKEELHLGPAGARDPLGGDAAGPQGTCAGSAAGPNQEEKLHALVAALQGHMDEMVGVEGLQEGQAREAATLAAMARLGIDVTGLDGAVRPRPKLRSPHPTPHSLLSPGPCCPGDRRLAVRWSDRGTPSRRTQSRRRACRQTWSSCRRGSRG